MVIDRWGNRVIQPYERRKYNDLIVQQLIKWHNGKCDHHPMTNECCPDFSCCYPELYEKNVNIRIKTLELAIEQARTIFR